ncbi:hypothetical protein P171DRAFT_437007 [Karstenula rhodostoma CBS 690.94]|uniref:Serine hydrolase domain-containing protein n=1 Tax=Karstenula rhodostoma CBS 690.94 TaxID=1392251 RepID=A0A9P4U513_9PLEO|nr:hypothetical protein P171DRAFT_437007 [Karstenula rhodostoma CBS 690.94]
MAEEISHFSNPDACHFQYFDPNARSYLRALQCLETYIQMNGPFDGVFGFSQGAGLALMYLIRHKHLHPYAPQPFKLAVLSLRVGVYDLGQWMKNGISVPLLSMPRGLSKIDLPVAVVWGENDWDAAKFEATTTTAPVRDEDVWTFVHAGGHEPPSPKVEGSIIGAVKAINTAVTQALGM